MNQIEKLAREFSRLLSEELPEEDLEKLVELTEARNMSGIDTDICHSHDFCDANMVMVEAYENIVGPWLNVLPDSKDMDLINEAWWMAQSNLFYLK